LTPMPSGDRWPQPTTEISPTQKMMGKACILLMD